MCGRFTQCLSWDEIHRLADLIGQPRNLRPRYNIAPTTQIEVVRRHDGGRELVPMRLGPCADGWKKPRAELPATSMRAPRRSPRSPCSAQRSSRAAASFPRQVSMSGQAPRVRRRRTISSPSSEPLALAGLWESNANQETKEMENSATIIVGPANEWMSRHTKKG